MRMQALQLTKAYKSRSRRGEALLAADHVDLELREGELADMFIAIADGSAKDGDLTAWIRGHLR